MSVGRTPPHVRRWGLALCAGLLVAAAPAAAQEVAETEIRLLREASEAEAQGEHGAAEARLRQILAERPSSVPALLSLERVLRVQARLGEMVPLVEAALEREPRSALLNQLLLRTYSALDAVRELDRAGARWIQTVPELEIPYRELANVWAARNEFDRARRVLEEGRRRMKRPDALALELGDLYASLGETRLAVAEWDRAVGPEGRGLSQVRRRLRALPDGGAAAIPRLVELLATEPATRHRLEAAVDLAVDAGLEARATELIARVLPEIPEGERESFLIDVARRADSGRMARLAYFAYLELLPAREAMATARSLAIQTRLAELALELGDTARAAATYEEVEAAYAEGTPQRRQAAALRIELMAGQAPAEAAVALREFRAEHPDAPELDRLAAAVADALIDGGAKDEAEPLLAGVRGPHSSLLRGRLHLERGELEAARTAYMNAVPGLRGAEATRVLSLITLLGRVSDASGRVLGHVVRLEERGEPGAALDRLKDALDTLPESDRPALLEFAGTLADEAGLLEDARRVRRILVADYPRSTEAPAALLALARSLRAEAGGAGEAQELLERLIIEYPRSALVPQARRELEQLKRAGVAMATQGREP